jgi:polyribonucleotide nucleotidyltransferase
MNEIEIIKLLIINNKELVLLWEKPIQHATQVKVKHINSEELGNINIFHSGTKTVQVEGKNWNKGFIIEKILQKIVLDFKDFTDAINIHNALQARHEKAEKILEEKENPPESWIKAFSQIVEDQNKNFERFYKIFQKTDLDNKVNSNKILKVSDFEACKIL